jgi:hypothetical protein
MIKLQNILNQLLKEENERLEANVGLLLKLDNSVKNQINTLISKMPTEPKGSTMTKLPDDKMHITLTSIKSFKPFKDKLKNFQLPEDIKIPNVELENAEFVYREDGKTTYVVAIKNQNDIKEFVDKIYQKIGETNPEPNRFFHITLANNQGGDPFKSIGNVEKSDLIKENKITLLNKEAKRMQFLAGLITELQLNEAENISQEIQSLVDKNEFLKGKIQATPSDIIEGNKFVLLFSEDAAKHIAERHLDKTKPGSLFRSGVNLRDVAKKLLNITPSEQTGGRVKWLGANGGNVGEMGVAKLPPGEVAKMKDYTMPDGQKEQVKIAPGKRKPTNEVSLITAELGSLKDGRKALSVITMFPGGTKIDGIEIPMNRGEFADKGLYFVVDPSSPLLK